MMGLLRFELRSQRPERCRMDQATLQPLLLVPPKRVHDLHMREKHAPAAVFVYSQVVQDFAGRLGLDALPVFLPDMGYYFATGIAPDWNQAVSPVGLLVLRPGTKSAELFPLFMPVIADEEISVVLGVCFFQSGIAGPLHNTLGDGRSYGIRLAHGTAAGDNDIDIHFFDQISCDLNGFLNLESGKAGLIDLQGHFVDAHNALSFL